jgi:hypothetical protein
LGKLRLTMVSKTDLDKAMAELQAQIVEARAHTDNSIQHAQTLVEERLERRLALAEEQARVKETQTATMMQAILHQLQSN